MRKQYIFFFRATHAFLLDVCVRTHILNQSIEKKNQRNNKVHTRLTPSKISRKPAGKVCAANYLDVLYSETMLQNRKRLPLVLRFYIKALHYEPNSFVIKNPICSHPILHRSVRISVISAKHLRIGLRNSQNEARFLSLQQSSPPGRTHPMTSGTARLSWGGSLAGVWRPAPDRSTSWMDLWTSRGCLVKVRWCSM